MSKARFNRGLRYGALVSALSISARAVQELSKYRDMMSDEDSKAVSLLSDTLLGIEQRTWTAADAEAGKR